MEKFSNFIKNLSVQHKLAIILSLIIVGTELLGLYTLRTGVNKGFEDVIAKQQFAFATRVASELEQSFVDRVSLLDAISKKIQKKKIFSGQDLEKFFHDDVTVNLSFPDGLFLYHDSVLVGKAFSNIDVQNDNNFSEFLLKLKQQNSSLISRPFLNDQGEPLVLFGNVLLYEGSNIRGYIVGAIKPARKEFVGDLMSLKIGEHGYAYLFNPSTRKIILHPDSSKNLRTKIEPGQNKVLDQAVMGFEGTDISFNSSGIEQLISVKVIPSSNWVLGVNYPVDDAFAPVVQLRNNLTSILIMCLLISIVFIYVLTLNLVKPLLTLTRNMEKFRNNLENAEPLPVDRKDEIGNLTYSYNTLIEKFQQELKNKNLAEQELKFKETFLTEITEAIGDSLVVTDKNEKIIFLNQQACWLFDLPEVISSEKYLGSIVNFKSKLPDENEREKITEPFSMEAEVGEKSIPLSVTINPIIKDMIFQGWVLSCRDIRERKKFEKEIQESKNSAEKANAAKSDFLAHMSHEIRTPMNGILGMTEVVLDSALSNEQKEHIDLIHKSAENLLTIINDILDLSKIEAGRMWSENKAFSLDNLIQEIFKIFQIRCDQKNINLILNSGHNVPNWIITDATRLRQVLLNLLGNALKFTEEGSIQVNIKTTNNSIEFSIQDTGIGIPESKIKEVFEAFKQVDSFIERKYGGTGLGLTICKKIIEHMGGKISCKSKEAKGSTFVFNVPFSIPSQEQIDEIKKENKFEESKIRKLTILLAEDNPVNQKFFEVIVKNAGHRLIIANNGEEAVMAIHEYPSIDIVFMDIQMPKVNGFEATERIRRDGFSLPIIGLSAHAMTGFKEEVIQHGLDDFLAKPIKGKDLLKYLQKKFGGDPIPENEENNDNGGEEEQFQTFSSKKLENNFGWGKSEFVQFLEMLAVQLDEGLIDAKKAIFSKDAINAQKILHALKGSLGIIEATESHFLCQEFDDITKNGKTDISIERWQKFEDSILRIQKEITDYLSKDGN